jgi:hypothetical protein
MGAFMTFPIAFVFLAAASSDPTVGASFVESTPNFDMGCTYSAQIIANGIDAKDPKHEAIQAIASFYFGRVDSELSIEESEVAANVVAAEFSGKDLQPYYERCRLFFAGRAKAWADLSLRMKAKEDAGAKK